MEAKILTITPEIAMEWLRNNRSNRPLSETNVRFIAEQIERGEWVVNGETIILAEDGRVLDGQHRLSAIVKTNIPIQSYVVTGMNENVFNTLGQSRTRTAGDILAMMGVKSYTLTGASIKFREKLKMGINLEDCGVKRLVGAKLNNTAIKNIYSINAPTWERWSAFALKCHRTLPILESSVVAGICAYLDLDLHFNVTKIEDFFTQLFDENETKNGTVQSLRKALIANLSARKKLLLNVKVGYISQAWRAYLEGKTVNRINQARVDFGSPMNQMSIGFASNICSPLHTQNSDC